MKHFDTLKIMIYDQHLTLSTIYIYYYIWIPMLYTLSTSRN